VWLIDQMDALYFISKLLPKVVALSNDKVPNVRVQVLPVIQKFILAVISSSSPSLPAFSSLTLVDAQTPPINHLSNSSNGTKEGNYRVFITIPLYCKPDVFFSRSRQKM
jgi:hypothetical protein